VLAGRDGRESLGVVHVDRRADRDHVQVVSLDERRPVGAHVGDAQLLARGFGPLAASGAQRDDLELGDQPEGWHLDDGAPPDADQSDTDGRGASHAIQPSLDGWVATETNSFALDRADRPIEVPAAVDEELVDLEHVLELARPRLELPAVVFGHQLRRLTGAPRRRPRSSCP
jgi:hypothetical protein